ncbi:MAG: 4Fe-4S binding protein [Deltaproteobacteria bacterium]|nr:4Fe-4S binding protein [Deltaproteobacteria bacterium]MBN2670504.1 4Fe-4S binding protein [Deltaproteobacteria bacterium]
MSASEPTCETTKGFVRTVKDKCRVCYTCVRECPAKAIRIVEGQAEVVASRCIACGNCVKVCSQGAKRFVRAIDEVKALLDDGDKRVVACIAPSFPAEFAGLDFRVLVGMLRALGFDLVTEVSFGADLVAERYRSLMLERSNNRYIATTCPAVVGYVEKYHPEIVPQLAPIVSPMIALARALHEQHGNDLNIVFIGPCIAKKAEAVHEAVKGEVDEVLTFKELKEMFSFADISPKNSAPSDFDPPHGGLGALFPINRGMLQAADMYEDLAADEIVSADGISEFVQAISEFAESKMDAKLLEVLSCSGCIMGPGMVSTEPKFRRRSRVSQYVRFRNYQSKKQQHHQDMNRFASLNLSRNFNADDQRVPTPSYDELHEILERLGKRDYSDELNCGACGYPTCRAHAIAIHKGLAEGEMCLPYVIERLKETVNDLSLSDARLATAQDQLLQSEKLASMGQLAAGVAHELNNPLGVVLMYSHLLLDELNTNSEMYDDLKMIADQAQRSKRIVANLLDFARENKVLFEEVNLEEQIRKSVESIPKPDNIELKMQFGHADPSCEMDPDQMMQVFTNIISNAYAAMFEGGTLTVSTTDSETRVKVNFIDTGVGISKENIEKVFQPFFTTKKIGKGTGLGLSVSYGIVKMHRGQISVTSNTDDTQGPRGTRFTVSIPRRSGAH